MDDKYILNSYVNGLVYLYTLHNCMGEIIKLNHEVFDKFKPSKMFETPIRHFFFGDTDSPHHLYKWMMEPIMDGWKIWIEDTCQCNMRILYATISGIGKSLSLGIGIDSTNSELSETLKEYKAGLEERIKLVHNRQQLLLKTDDSGTTLAEHAILAIDELIAMEAFEGYLKGGN